MHLAHRVLTDTLVAVPSGPDTSDAREMVFEAIQHHILQKAKFPLSTEGELCSNMPRLQCISSGRSFDLL